MADNQQEKESSKEATAQKSSSLKWVIIAIVLMVVLGAGGFLGWNLLANKDSSAAEDNQQIAESRVKKKGEAKILCPLESFIVNLMDKSGLGKRYLKVTMELEVGDEEGKSIIDTHKTQLKDTILLLLSGLSFEEINSIEGKLSLKQALLSRTNQILGGNIISRIYFTEFVVQ